MEKNFEIYEEITLVGDRNEEYTVLNYRTEDECGSIASNGFWYENKGYSTTFGYKDNWITLEDMDTAILANYIFDGEMPDFLRTVAEFTLKDIIEEIELDWEYDADNYWFFLEKSNFGLSFSFDLDTIIRTMYKQAKEY